MAGRTAKRTRTANSGTANRSGTAAAGNAAAADRTSRAGYSAAGTAYAGNNPACRAVRRTAGSTTAYGSRRKHGRTAEYARPF